MVELKLLKNQLIILILVLFSGFATQACSNDRTIYLVRHAEKMADDSADPPLTKLGLERALNIANILKEKKISQIYSTDLRRTRQTAAPLANKLGLKVIVYDPRKLKNFAEMLKTTSGNILVVGHSNTTPQLSVLLGGKSFGDIEDSEYNRVYQLIFHPEGVESFLLSSKVE